VGALRAAVHAARELEAPVRCAPVTVEAGACPALRIPCPVGGALTRWSAERCVFPSTHLFLRAFFGGDCAFFLRCALLSFGGCAKSEGRGERRASHNLP
jgi:hypothetical protein